MRTPAGSGGGRRSHRVLGTLFLGMFVMGAAELLVVGVKSVNAWEWSGSAVLGIMAAVTCAPPKSLEDAWSSVSPIFTCVLGVGVLVCTSAALCPASGESQKLALTAGIIGSLSPILGGLAAFPAFQDYPFMMEFRATIDFFANFTCGLLAKWSLDAST